MRLVQGMPPASRCVFRDQFRSLRETSDQGGIVVASTIAGAGTPGISPTGASGRVTYNGTEALLINATQATWVLRFRTGAVLNATQRALVDKSPSALNDNQFLVELSANLIPIVYICSSAADIANNFYAAAGLATNTEYVLHAVYNGALAAASRGALYVQGNPVAKNITGVIPTSMRASAVPINIFQLNGSVNRAPDTDFIIREARIHSFAMSAEEVADDAADRTYSEVI